MENPSQEPSNLSISLLALDHIPSTEKHTLQPFNTTRWRWVALVLMNLLLLGDYVVIDGPQAIETQIESTLKLSTQEYSYLYSSWALPSIFIPFFGGYLTDYLGVRPTLVISCIILTLGQLVYFLGANGLSFGWMLAGRAIYAIGSNPLNVAQIVIIYKWFHGKEIAFAMAVSSTTSCIGRALNSFVVPKIYEATQNLGAPILFGLLVCVVSTVACFIMVLWDKANDERGLAVDPNFSNEVEEIENTEKISIKDVKHFGLAVWLLVLNFGLTDGYFFSFNAFANDFYHLRYQLSNSAAGNIISVNYLVGAIASVLFGMLVDKKGYRASIILYSSFLGILGFLYFFAFPECPGCISTVIPQILFGLLIGVNDATTFPSLPLVLEEKYLGTGYGLFFVFQNTLIFVLPPIAACINDATSNVQDGFFWMLMFFCGLACLTLLESFMLFLKDRKLGRILDTFLPMEEEEEEINGDEPENRDQEEGEHEEEKEKENVEVPPGEAPNSGKKNLAFSARETLISTVGEL